MARSYEMHLLSEPTQNHLVENLNNDLHQGLGPFFVLDGPPGLSAEQVVPRALARFTRESRVNVVTIPIGRPGTLLRPALLSEPIERSLKTDDEHSLYSLGRLVANPVDEKRRVIHATNLDHYIEPIGETFSRFMQGMMENAYDGVDARVIFSVRNIRRLVALREEFELYGVRRIMVIPYSLDEVSESHPIRSAVEGANAPRELFEMLGGHAGLYNATLRRLAGPWLDGLRYSKLPREERVRLKIADEAKKQLFQLYQVHGVDEQALFALSLLGILNEHLFNKFVEFDAFGRRNRPRQGIDKIQRNAGHLLHPLELGNDSLWCLDDYFRQTFLRISEYLFQREPFYQLLLRTVSFFESPIFNNNRYRFVADRQIGYLHTLLREQSGRPYLTD